VDIDRLPPRPTGIDLVVDLNTEAVDAFRRDGFTSIQRITTDEELEWLGVLYDELFDRKQAGFPGGYFDLARPYESAGADALPQALFPEMAIPALVETVYYRNARRMVAQLLAEDESALRGWGHMILKPAFHGHATPWHQDEAYWESAKTYNAAGVWMPLDDADETNGCMTFLPGSHRFEVLRHRHIGDDPAVHGLEVVEAIDTSRAVAVPLAAGGATFHHPRMLHYTGPNRSPRRRRAYANEFQTEPSPREAVAERPWVDEGRAAWDRREVQPGR
jgi:hypothetical protein